MSEHIIPYDTTNSTNPFLMEKKSNLLLGPENKELTAEYIWNKIGKDRDNLVEWIFNHYRKNGFPKLQETETNLRNTYEKLIKRDISDILNERGEIKNSASMGSNIIKHFCYDLLYATKGEKSPSCIDIFNDDDLLKRVIRNRCGYYTTKEDGTERPYVFAFSDAMLIQGMRSTAIGFNVSMFKTLVAKFIMKTHCIEGGKVLDYAAGFGQRALAAGTLGLKYTGIDPFTYNAVNNMIKYFDITGNVYNDISENNNIYKELKDYDLAFSSPPFFNLEIYSNDNTQSYNKYNYDEWLSKYWEETVKNCFGSLKTNGIFILSMIDKYGKNNLGIDMSSICKKYMKHEKTYNVKVSRSHLSGKKESGVVSKTTERFYVFRKL